MWTEREYHAILAEAQVELKNNALMKFCGESLTGSEGKILGQSYTIYYELHLNFPPVIRNMTIFSMLSQQRTTKERTE